jgi:hypothetical protein
MGQCAHTQWPSWIFGGHLEKKTTTFVYFRKKIKKIILDPWGIVCSQWVGMNVHVWLPS